MAKLVFMGTPVFSVPVLKALIDHHEVVGVVTQPDRPAGRGGKVRQSPIKQIALEHDIPVYQPQKLRRKKAIAELQAWHPPIDLYIVAAFGQILPQAVLNIPAQGSINVHASLLPRWRGAAPIHAAIRAGDVEAGITIMLMDAGLDTGPMLSKRSLLIAPDETGQTLHDKLSQMGADLLIDTLPSYLAGDIQPQPQPEAGVTYAPQIEKEEGNIDWLQDAASIERLVRAFTPWPGTYTHFRNKQLKIHTGHLSEGEAPAGKVIAHEDGVAIGTGDGLYIPTEVQLAGKKRAHIADFINGYIDFVGTTLPDKADS